ncbi:MAG: radical SAM protein [Candidatus Hodarchaeota archaeon]
MIVSVSKKMMQRSFEKISYRFTDIPKPELDGDFGIYIHVPFCYSKCSFCPFYKEIYSENLKKQYLAAILKEIEDAELCNQAKWIYVGGGTPNTLDIEEIRSILDRIKHKIKLNSLGIELLPTLITDDYLRGLKKLGFSKISIGIESYSNEVMEKTGRKIGNNEHIGRILKYAKSLGLFVNVDMMVGLPGQDAATFRQDIREVRSALPDQITIYPFMILRGLKATPSSTSEEQYELIEEANEMLRNPGYDRKSVWTFAFENDVYDSSRDELVMDYVGFGPAAFSTYGNWKVVNPELDVYLRNFKDGKKLGFVASKSRTSDDWRKFAAMIYEGKIDSSQNLPTFMRFLIRILRLLGYIKRNTLTEKGRIFAHEITKTVVESLPFPIQNPDCVENYGEYVLYRDTANS